MNEKMRVLETKEKKGLTITDLILVGILLAAGAVLKFFVGSVINVGGMKPNFIIAMYCLAVLIIRPKITEAVIIGLLSGIICQFFPGTPYINIISELFGAASMALLIRLPLNIGKFNLRPIAGTFISTLISVFIYLGILYLALYSGFDVKPTGLIPFLGVIFGTAAINSIIVQILYVPVSAAVKKQVNV